MSVKETLMMGLLYFSGAVVFAECVTCAINNEVQDFIATSFIIYINPIDRNKVIIVPKENMEILPEL